MKRLCVAGSVTALTLTWGGAAFGQAALDAGQAQAPDSAAGQQNSEIIVTARKRAERLLDVPQSVSVVSADALQQVHAERLDDFFNRVPSASIVESQAGQARVILRGINTGGVSATVATYVDETPYGSATALANGAVLTPDLDPADIARVEILRGPQGTLYGANSLGGLVKYVSVAPRTDAIHGSAEAKVETVDHGNVGWSGRAALNLPLGDSVAIRASGLYRRDPGYIDDPVKGRDINDGRTYGGRVSLLAKPVENLTLRATAVLQNLNSNGPNTIDVNPASLKPVIGDYSQSRIVEEPSRTRYRVYSGTGTYDFGPVELVSATSWGNLDQNSITDTSGVYGPLLTDAFATPLGAAGVQQIRQRRFTQEVRLTSSGRQIFAWTLGAFYTRERNIIDQSLNGVVDPTGAPAAGLDGLALVTIASRYREIAGFASGTIHFTPQFDLTAGGRYSHNKQDATQVTGGPLQDNSTFGSSSSDNVFTYSVAPSFKPNDRTTIYARVARGYRPGGPNILLPAAPAAVPRQFGADTTTSYEIGIKSELLDRKLSVELTGFYIDWKRIQLLTSINNFAVNTNGGSARSKGIELSATAYPARADDQCQRRLCRCPPDEGHARAGRRT